MLKYSTSENFLTDREDDFSASVHAAGYYDKSAIIEQMLNRGTLVTRTDILAVLNNYEETLADILLDGGTVTTPLFNSSFSISGVFEGPMDSFDGSRHKLNINLTKGTLLREVEKRVKFEKTTAVTPMPLIQEVKDSISGSYNDKLTPGGVIEIRGNTLKIEGDMPECGLWFVFEDGTETKASVFIENKPARIIAMIPVLSAGEYHVKIVTQFSGGGKPLKTQKTCTFTKTLSVM